VIHEQAKDDINTSSIVLGLIHSADGAVFCI
jgi:hypothetical protein